ncbi:hypothetical protein [Protaetiibacter intestinalis]|uniref:Abi family protein n=1 Tax=Protaetiibacter intestinalis TaxID=2419774 RepID=A0A387BG70_9MICO|nr:hypothetical protein [Protaetiibacter intestinalis]AYF97500.1 hypothetical protein D7I47_03995 [Protaetiibacter intestinalis]
MPRIEPATERLIGRPRLLRLLADVEGDHRRANDLFAWNVAAAGAAMEAVHVFELILRNALDRELRVWNANMNGDPDWLLTPHEFLHKSLRPADRAAALQRARRIAAERGRPVRHDDVLAQLSLGTWRYLLPSRSVKAKQRLWDAALSHAFPAWPGDWGPESVVTRVASAHELRNRVAHLEPLQHLDLRRVRRDMRSVCHAIGPDAARFFVQAERLIPIIETNPIA